jgi:predicted Holliday junction resolvase-like endonuclease
LKKINKRLKLITSGLATTWEESESEKMLGVGKRKKIISSKLQDAAALVVEKPRRSNPRKVTNTTTGRVSDIQAQSFRPLSFRPTFFGPESRSKLGLNCAVIQAHFFFK